MQVKEPTFSVSNMFTFNSQQYFDFVLASTLEIRKQIKGGKGKGSLCVLLCIITLNLNAQEIKLMLHNMYSNILCFSFSRSSNELYAKRTVICNLISFEASLNQSIGTQFVYFFIMYF